MGVYFQIQPDFPFMTDYLDCFGFPEVMGKTSSALGCLIFEIILSHFKCSWLFVQVLVQCVSMRGKRTSYLKIMGNQIVLVSQK
ncbi:farnesyl pyrophosphate synthase 2 [Aegilops tauschii subsp. strangulata]|uniref:farnesyl pyrophosphate synthase 2 n=1 Tax=Triticum aestivum TaxID=4565 RepID=UPI001D02D159|nr:farnesyl pyrophosphate synthase 2-like [Triticum aestivum]XP_045090804.1 farnesyl pyrophosphate synthase 2-like [Aegilops tauschii subsp. strangulata]